MPKPHLPSAHGKLRHAPLVRNPLPGLVPNLLPGLFRNLLPGLFRNLPPGLFRNLPPGLFRNLPPGLVRNLLSGLVFALVFGLVFLAGCGYHTAGSATHIPAGVRTIAVPVFTTHTQAYHTEMALTQAVVRELNTRTRYRVLTAESEDSDAVLSGVILTQTSVPLTYDSTSGETSSYLVTITVKVVLTARDGRVLYQNDALSYREQYQSTQDLSGSIREDPAAVNRLARDFAQALVGDLLESF